MDRSSACDTALVPSDPEWTFVAVAAREGDLKHQARTLLAANGFEGVSDADIKIDVICARGGEDSVRVWVRSESRKHETGVRRDGLDTRKEGAQFYVVGEPKATDLGIVVVGTLFAGLLRVGDTFSSCEGPRSRQMSHPIIGRR